VGRKNSEHTDEKDALADFFGDDLDWLDEDAASEEALPPDLATGEELVVAPLPSEPDPTVSVSDQASAPAPEEAPPGPAPAPAPPAPPAAAPPPPPQAAEPPSEPPAESTVEEPAPASPVEPEAELEEHDPTTSIAEGVPLLAPAAEAASEVDPTSEERSPAETEEVEHTEDSDWEEPVSEIIEVLGEELEANGQTPEPLVRVSSEPPPHRERDPAGTGGIAFTAPAEARPTSAPGQRYVPGDEADEWRTVAKTLVSEAAIASSEARGPLLFWAARVYRRRLGEEDGASALLHDAMATGWQDPRLHRERASATLHRERWSEAERAFADLAQAREGLGRAEAFQDAAGMAIQRDDDEAATAHMRASVQADPEDYIAWSLLGDRLAATGADTERIEVLARLAALAPPAIGADLLWEQGALHHAQGEVGAAREAWEAAMDQWPAHAPALLSLRASFLETGDDAARAALYEREANRPGQTDAGWWFLKAARAFEAAGNEARARSMYTAAAALGDPEARREQQAFLHGSGRWEDLATALEQEERREKDKRAKAFAAYRRAVILEHRLGDPERALAAYRRAVALDPSAEPASEAVTRLLEQSDEGGAVIDAWLDRAVASKDRVQRADLYLRAGERAERQGDLDRAERAWEALAGEGSEQDNALLGLVRIARTRGDAAARRAAWLRAAEQAPDKAHAAAWRFLAVTAPPPVEALDDLVTAALDDPANAVLVDGAIEAARATGDAEAALRVLEAAGAAQSGRAASTRWYAAARIALDDLGDAERATAAVARALEADPTGLPGRVLARELAEAGGASRGLVERFRARAEAAERDEVRAWWHVAAALASKGVENVDADRDLAAALGIDAVHPGALALREIHCLTTRDWRGLVDAWRAAVDADAEVKRRAWRLAWLAELL